MNRKIVRLPRAIHAKLNHTRQKAKHWRDVIRKTFPEVAHLLPPEEPDDTSRLRLLR
jgi:hypothetical protein